MERWRGSYFLGAPGVDDIGRGPAGCGNTGVKWSLDLSVKRGR